MTTPTQCKFCGASGASVGDGTTLFDCMTMLDSGGEWMQSFGCERKRLLCDHEAMEALRSGVVATVAGVYGATGHSGKWVAYPAPEDEPTRFCDDPATAILAAVEAARNASGGMEAKP